MPFLSVLSNPKDRLIAFMPGSSLQEVLDTTDLRVRTGCRGSGACGLCRVQILAGTACGPTKNELLLLSEKDLLQGVRLACQVTATEDLRIRILRPATRSNWRKLNLGEIPDRTSQPQTFGKTLEPDAPAFGVAVDLGTTTISLSLWDFSGGRCLSRISGRNGQSRYGSDVMTRLSAACRSKKSAGEISQTVRNCIAEGLLEMCSSQGTDPRKIRTMAIVGNTAMLSLLTEKGLDLLIRPHYWTKSIDCRPGNTENWFEAGELTAKISVRLHQPLAGFVGSDLLAGVLSTRLTETAAGSLLIDFGTNSEIALWDGTRLWVTSAAGGPAFEGSGMRCGMPAGPGSIYRIDQNDGSGLTTQVIGHEEAQGLCGSGLVDLIAYLTRTGKIDKKGRFTGDPPEKRFVLSKDNPDLFLDGGDIDRFQRAKAAIGAGVRFLLKSARMDTGALKRICICGSFGSYLNVLNAQQVGLLPSISLERVEFWGNAALRGCEFLLLSSEKGDDLQPLREKSRMINLSQVPEFEDLFLESLFLQPMPRQ
jgi:uncharacterized 2Fe-2S/4Fe-4S cluster protein (DUF4445 family)